jgi:hypothetical protein
LARRASEYRAHTKQAFRPGALTFVDGGVLAVVGELMRGPMPNPSMNLSGYAAAALVPGFGMGWILILLAVVSALFGTTAIYGFLAGCHVDRLAFWA